MVKRYEAQLEDGTRILSQRYGEGWSDAEAWGHFCCVVWQRARDAGSKTVIMGEQYSTLMMKREVPDPPENMDSWTMLNAPRIPGLFKIQD
jgi:hypothetical protein